MPTRREFLASAALVPAALASAPSAQADSWQPGSVEHLLPTASHDRILLKASFRDAHPKPPQLRVGKRTVDGARTDTAGRFWRFDAAGLAPGEPHRLELVDARGRSLCDPWTLKTFPAPSAEPQSFRLLVYTCAGGDERVMNARGKHNFLPIALRRRFFERALALQPDAVISNGDHTYWDLHQTGSPNFAEDVIASVGRFDRKLPVLGTENELVHQRVCEHQIRSLYGNLFRSVPTFFIQDDHDYFENDDANDRMVTFPPDHFMLQLGRASRRLYFPEFLPDANRPAGLPGASAVDRSPGVGEAYGTIRCGRLAEVLLYDCRRYLTLAGPNAVIVAREAEDWLMGRMADREVRHVVHAPSMPPVWSAGKWGDWYPDFLDDQGVLGTKKPKPYYQAGWLAQHDRIFQAASAMPDRTPLIVSGDMHAIGECAVQQSGALDLSKNPVHVALPGPISTLNGWPSGGRRTPPLPAEHVRIDASIPALEENGFLLADFTPASIRLSFYRWNPSLPETAIDNLMPFQEVELKR
ncbi:MAG: hypothetical protein GC160_06220 [Acidobacteria bacterium]|nr:hypothetical protein [Acidobacteriota bacterium]